MRNNLQNILKMAGNKKPRSNQHNHRNDRRKVNTANSSMSEDEMMPDSEEVENGRKKGRNSSTREGRRNKRSNPRQENENIANDEEQTNSDRRRSRSRSASMNRTTVNFSERDNEVVEIMEVSAVENEFPDEGTEFEDNSTAESDNGELPEDEAASQFDQNDEEPRRQEFVTEQNVRNEGDEVVTFAKLTAFFQVNGLLKKLGGRT